ncbi:MAG: hypothetical protein DRJ35_04550 [Thermoprotei archaeon]|nr:MAG: hypothetical protein DRJ35_04550 [Thermoprotei archaeon]
MKILQKNLSGIKTIEAVLEDGEEALIVSDTHFGLKIKGVYATSYIELTDMVERLKRDGRKIALVVLLGDIFELWTGNFQGILSTSYDFLKSLADLKATILYVSGNHDRIISNISLKSNKGLGDLYIVPEFAILNVSGKRLVLMHGHQFDTLFLATKGLWKIQSYIYTISEAFIALPGPTEWILAVLSAMIVFAIVSFMPKYTLSELVTIYLASFFLFLPLIILVWRTIQDKIWYLFLIPVTSTLFRGKSRGKTVNEMISKKSFRSTVELLEELIGKISGIVFGHTHVPGLVSWRGIIVANSGSWIRNQNSDEHNTFILVNSRGITLYIWKDSEYQIVDTRGFQ